jgi:DNA-binding transcriptional ArsR family regulator
MDSPDQIIVIEIFTSTRTRIMMNLKERPHTVSEIAKKTGYSKTTISYHLAKLNELGMVERDERGKWVYYRLTEKGLRSIRREIAGIIVSLLLAVSSMAGMVWKLIPKKEVTFAVEKAPVTPAVKESVITERYDIALLVLLGIFIFSLLLLGYIRFFKSK